MNSDARVVGIGLLIGLGAAALLLGGMIVRAGLPAPTPLPTSTRGLTGEISMFTPTYTLTPTLTVPTKPGDARTAVPPSAASSPISPAHTLSVLEVDQAIFNNGVLSMVGPLDQDQQALLYQISTSFIRANNSESRLVGEQINGPGYGSPSDICGPLSIAILQGAGLLAGTDLSPYDFWLLNPDVSGDRQLLRDTFPRQRFLHTRVKTSLKEVDWQTIPLYPGDFMYLYAGTGGNFEHMLVVSRVDSAGRAYSVTNYNTSDGFLIGEVLLYDPEDPQAGMFQTWTQRPNALLGATGFGGFELWRMRASTKLLANTLGSSRP